MSAYSYDTPGPMTRSVEDASLLYARLLDYSDSIKKAAQDSLNQLNKL